MPTQDVLSFPLNFDAKQWAVEDAVPWIFFWEEANSSFQSISTSVVPYLMNHDVGQSLRSQFGKDRFAAIENLQRHLINLLFRNSTPKPKRGFPPIIWCRVALQYWLNNGGGNEIFLAAMTRWAGNKSKQSPIFVFYDREGSKKKNRVSLVEFLFVDIDIATGNLKNFRLRRVKQDSPTTKSSPPIDSNRSTENSIGRNAISFVRELIEKAAGDRTISNLRSRRDPTTQKFRYTGTRSELYDDLCRINDRCATRYRKGVVIKAISLNAKCRKHWPRP